MDEIAALEPCYGRRGGNAVRVYTQDGNIHEEEKTTRAMRNSIAAHYNVDLKANSSTYGAYLNRTLNIPIPLTATLTLVPLKVRCPKYGSDGATGYINLHEIANIKELPGSKKGEPRCLVELKSGQAVPCYYTCRKTTQCLHEARRVHEQFLERHKLTRGGDKVREVIENLGLGRWEKMNRDILVLVTEDPPEDYS